MPACIIALIPYCPIACLICGDPFFSLPAKENCTSGMYLDSVDFFFFFGT